MWCVCYDSDDDDDDDDEDDNDDVVVKENTPFWKNSFFV